MKKALMFAPLALAACVPQSGGVASTPAPTPAPAICATNVIMDEKALAGLTLLYVAPAQAYVTADKNGVLPANVKAAMKPILTKMYAWLLKARAAKAVGDTASFACAATAMGDLSGVANILLK